ncbi:ComEC/Rec2 family competence protein [Pareuzebyella sediminis]|uniref:ComEC/Rec2 family competence protein n=1 Tax=Pareuzebyella sediminis TaxID=2607998 RepID=UPI0011ED90B8|nr:ComEC/Rec2 family competence protein [Pareuzebyella sediminis]
MRLLRFIPIKLTLALISGIVLGKYLEPDPIIVWVFTLVFFALLAYIFFRQQSQAARKISDSIVFGTIVMLVTITIGVLSISMADPTNSSSHYSNSEFEGNRIWHLKIREVLKPTSFSDRYTATVLQVGKKNVTGKILVTYTADSSSNKFGVDDELVVYGQLVKIQEPLNPHQFDYKKYLNGLGIHHQFRLQKTNYSALQNKDITLLGLAANIRYKIISKLKEADFGNEELAIIQALLLGQRNDISPDTFNAYKDAGAVHILAVSGLHIGILLLLLQYLLKPLERLPKGNIIKLCIIVVLLWCFALIAGFSASIVRAVSMFSFVAYSLYLNRPNNTFNILALSILFILLVIDPQLLFQVGFQMSYAAVFAIVWVYPLLQRYWTPKYRLLRYPWRLLCVSVAAQLGVLPISLFYFHQFPGLFFISNLIVVPFLGILLGFGILIIVLALTNVLPTSFVTMYDTFIRWMNTVVRWIANQETFIFNNISFDIVELVLLYGILVCLVNFLFQPNYRKFLATLSFIVLFQSWGLFIQYQIHQKKVLFLAHQVNNSILVYQNGSSLDAKVENKIKSKRIITDYSIAEGISTTNYSPLENSYQWKDRQILILDSPGIVAPVEKRIDYLVLTQSPKVNLERVIDILNPKIILADGSNFRTYVNRWQETCSKRQIPFHFTGKKGSYLFLSE